MRVLHITTEYPPIVYGGLGTAVGGLVGASAVAGLEVAVLLVGHGDKPGYTAEAFAPGAPVHSEPQHGAAIWSVPHSESVSASVEFALRWCPDVIHVHVFWLAHVAAAVRRATGVPLIYTVHSLDRAEYELGQGPPECLSQWPIQADLICDADRIIALTAEERELVGEYCPQARPRVRVVGNGIADHRHAAEVACRRISVAAHPLTILYTGRFVDRKGIRELLDAAPAILADPSCRLVMAGGHRGVSAYDIAAHWLPQVCEPYRDRILFTGWLDSERLSRWYADADILVVPSWYEPFGMVILEGMLYGLAIVAARVGGPKEILSDEETGLFCEPRDVASIEQQVVRLMKDSALRGRLGRKAASAVRSHWLHEHVLSRMIGVYRETTHLCSLA